MISTVHHPIQGRASWIKGLQSFGSASLVFRKQTSTDQTHSPSALTVTLLSNLSKKGCSAIKRYQQIYPLTLLSHFPGLFCGETKCFKGAGLVALRIPHGEKLSRLERRTGAGVHSLPETRYTCTGCYEKHAVHSGSLRFLTSGCVDGWRLPES